MPRSIMDLAGLAGTLVFAIPVALYGVDLLVSGRALGAVFLLLAGAMVAVEEYLFAPTDLPGRAVETVVGGLVKPPEDGEAADAQADDELN